MTRAAPPQLMGVAEVVAATGLAKQTVSGWAKHPPAGIPPHADLAAGPIWRERDMRPWLAATGRLANRTQSN